MIPDFFIVGAPKCGTTSLAAWLGEHPGVFISDPKEPHYYSPELVSFAHARTRTEYEALFSEAKNGQSIGEASTGYLRSKSAVPCILRDRPNARLIVCLRNPIEMVPSVHAQLLKTGRERQRDLELVWSAQEGSRVGPKQERYVDICRLGIQVERLLAVAARDQVLFVLLEDFQANPHSTYGRVLEFIGLDDDGRTEFPVMNPCALPRSLAVARLARILYQAKHQLGISRKMGIKRWIERFNNDPAKAMPTAMSRCLRNSLLETFRSDIERLEALIERDLSHWRSSDVGIWTT